MGLQVGAINLFKKVLANGKRVETQTLNGKTITNVYDEAGNLLKTRAKKIERYNVGDKKVITTTVFEGGKDCYDYAKIVKDKVYTQEGKFLGSRTKSAYKSNVYDIPGSDPIHREKSRLKIADIAMNMGYYDKTLKAGDISKYTSYQNGIREFSNTSPHKGCINFNEHGLPKFNLETNGMENLF